MARFVKVLSTSLILRSRRLSREAFLIAAGFYAYSMLIFPGILTSVALIALFPLGAAYALSLYVNQWVAQRDLRTLYDDRVIDIPHILYLRSFDAEKSGVGFRLLRAIDPRRIASSTSFYTPAGREIYRFYDVEEQLADSFSRVGLVVAIGDKGTSFGDPSSGRRHSLAEGICPAYTNCGLHCTCALSVWRTVVGSSGDIRRPRPLREYGIGHATKCLR